LWTDLSNQIHLFLSGISLADLVSQGQMEASPRLLSGQANTAEFLNFVNE
jgi:hypothetical protein